MSIDELDGLTYYPLVPLLIRSAKTADTAVAHYDSFMLQALRTTAMLINRFGYDPDTAVHRDAIDWIFQSNASNNIEVAAGSIWALGDLGVPPTSVCDRLEELVVAEPRRKGDSPNTCRALAFRMLARLERETAKKYINSPACSEFRAAISFWFDDLKNRYPDNANLPQELYNETQWLGHA